MDHMTRVAVIGAGLGGLTVAGLLQRDGFAVTVFEQASEFWRIGAGIILGASTAKVLRRLGLEEALVQTGIRPDAFVSRDVATGTVLNDMPFDAAAEARFGGAFVNIHRADLHRLLLSRLAPRTVRFGHRLLGLDETGDGVRLSFADGLVAEADIVIGADGIRSVVREAILGHEPPRYVGKVAIRAVFPRARAPGVPMRDCTKWWGEDRHVLAYFMTERRDECYVMAAIPDDRWDADTPPAPGSRDTFLDAFPTAHPELRQLLMATENVSLLPICDRPRRDVWSSGRTVLMGDACHAVRPFMAAGGAMAIEDAAVLARAITTFDEPEQAFARYAAIRIPRVGDVQRISAENSWLRVPGETDWFFGYDPFAAPVDRAA
ncbi:6-hydroxynicotinate 3-monooxygenase [Methylobacterium terricola]|uniref:6-hydroxynicotinate 3-monooxygenase n=1 Tax=Methylobacterium terricola TaxID=2583531 RepID=A0A5C4L999_9HYPH|nr:FAD-dependent monooxygenase [Methylobacterium terricola]TNC08344.1 6-hydroxynicotinate 3-monooxygenase [Methylobacterium terricola]